MNLVDKELEEVFNTNAQKLVRRVMKQHMDTIKYYDSYEDMEQTLLLCSWKALPSYDESKGKFSTWITTITENSIKQHVRLAKSQKRNRALQNLSLSQAVAQDLTLEETLSDGGDLVDMIEEARLVERIKDCLCSESYAYYIDGMSQADIGRVTGHSASYIGKLIQRNINQIKYKVFKGEL